VGQPLRWGRVLFFQQRKRGFDVFLRLTGDACLKRQMGRFGRLLPYYPDACAPLHCLGFKDRHRSGG
ncbi:hypothetical protein, partial [Neisseria dentiae]|uniref:hypothetical protein n=1 Tax=Neisseria dentiae TaxID=194197 RepID=UPI0035A0067D